VIIVDQALERREQDGSPIRVGLVGAGFMGRAIALQILKYTRGMGLVAISNRHIERARDAYSLAGVDDVQTVTTEAELEAAIDAARPAVTDDAMVVCTAAGVDVVVEVTGAVEFGAKVAMTAIQHGKHIVLMNAELDGTLGWVLKRYADDAGVIYTNSDGDQPGVLMNLYRFVSGIGVTPVLCGIVKGLHDPYRNPTTQDEFARRWGQNPRMVTSFADGTKISFEEAVVANATGLGVARRGMYGVTVPAGTHIQEAASAFPVDELLAGPGIVDYVVGAEPNPGVFVFGTSDDAMQRHYLDLYKLGSGPLYCFYTPYHLCHFEVPTTVARAVLFQDAAIAPAGTPQVEVVTTAKIELKAGEILDGPGGYMSYGLAENADVARTEGLLPMGLAEGCRVLRNVAPDEVLTYRDVERPEGRLIDGLRAEQDALSVDRVGEAAT
jgi:predicted homoserine dehydrogenase-like protein